MNTTFRAHLRQWLRPVRRPWRKAMRLHREGELWPLLTGMTARRLRLVFTPPKTVQVLDGNPVLTVAQCCQLLRIAVPDEYRAERRLSVDQTDLLNDVDNRVSVVMSMRSVRDRHHTYSLDNEAVFKPNRRDAKSFKRWYDAMPGQHSDVQLLRWYARYKYGFAPAGFSAENYITLRLYDTTLPQAQALFVTTRQAFHFTAYRDKAAIKYFNNKALFLSTFGAFVHRDWLDMRQAGLDEFLAFCQRHHEFVRKPLNQSQGLGIEVIVTPESPRDRVRLYRALVRGRVLAEQVIHQHPALALVNESSLNTVRVHTVRRPTGDIDVVVAYVRFGRGGSPVDNFHSQGVAALIDVATGVTTTGASNLRGDYFERHPESGVELIGFQVPCWDKVRSMATAAAAVIPQMHQVGWDIAVTDEGEAEMVEGNSFPSLSTTLQILDCFRGNIKPLYEKYFDEFDNWAATSRQG